MRLINVKTMKLEHFQGEHKPPYAILSHTWGHPESEVSFDDFEDLQKASLKDGFKKIDYLCKQAKLSNIAYAWADTACINKSSSSELSEAINSMFDWYSKAKVCYAYLSDVDTSSKSQITPAFNIALENPGSPITASFRESNWFKRGWTLQELIAPKHVRFFDVEWRHLGEKLSCIELLSSITGISSKVLSDPANTKLEMFATRMSWASNRTTTRPEDVAYCLLGLFGVHMPLLYGEGTKAFTRLQEELVRSSSPTSLMAWGAQSKVCIEANADLECPFPENHTVRPVFAEGPEYFKRLPHIEHLNSFTGVGRWAQTNRGTELRTLLVDENWFRESVSKDSGIGKRYDYGIVVLPFKYAKDPKSYAGFLICGNASLGIYNRIDYKGFPTVKVPARLARRAKPKEICLSSISIYHEWRSSPAYVSTDQFVFFEFKGFKVEAVTVRCCEWDEDDQSLRLFRAVPEEFQEALFKIADRIRPELSFYLLLSNSLILPAALPSPRPAEVWRFRRLTMEVVTDEYGKRLFTTGLHQQAALTEVRKKTIHLNDSTAVVTLEQNFVYWDKIHVVTVRTPSEEEMEMKRQLERAKNSVLQLGMETG
jgi:hypothetical protein